MIWLLAGMLAVAGMPSGPATASIADTMPGPAPSLPAPVSGPEYLVLADQALRQGRMEQAGAMIDMLTRDPRGAAPDDIILLRVEYLVTSGRPDEAQQALAQIQDRTRNPCRLEPLLGWAAERNAKPAEAADHYRAALSICPDDAGLWNRLGLVLIAMGNGIEGRKAFDRALILAPDNVEILINAGYERLGRGALADATMFWQKARSLAPNDGRVMDMGDVLHGAAGQPPERGAHESDNRYAGRLLTAMKGARLAGRSEWVQSLEARALLLLDRYDPGMLDGMPGEGHK